jgi:hypothetical protein
MTSYKVAALQEKATCLFWGFQTKSVIKMQCHCRTQYEKDRPLDNLIRRWLKQFQETGSVLHRRRSGRPSTSQEDVDRIHEVFYRSSQSQLHEFL